MYKIEKRLRSDGLTCIAGVDEVGRGPLAGPVVAAAVILPDGSRMNGIRDSKKLAEKKRKEMFEKFKARKAIMGIGIVDEDTIDRLNIFHAARLAMKNAVLNLRQTPDYLLIDGKITLDLSHPQMGIVNGDIKSASIAAASIVAKVTRDEIMVEYDRKYPGYGFAKHKGYGTKEHLAFLKSLGPSPIHRLSFGPVLKACG